MKNVQMKNYIWIKTWLKPLTLVVEAQWLGGRLPDSRSREPSHESPTHIGIVGDVAGLAAVFRYDKNKMLLFYLILGNKL